MTLVEKISADLRDAMKASEKTRLMTLRLLVAQITNQKIALKTENISDEEVQKVIQREIKKRKEAQESFATAGRSDDANREEAEKKILEAYLPQQMSDEDLKKIVLEVVTVAKEQGAIHAGKITGMVLAKVKGLADGGRVKQVVEKVIKS